MNILDGLVSRLFGRLIARQFVVFGGVSAVLKKGAALVRKGITPTYNRIDEHVRDRRRIREICESYLELGSVMDHTNHGNMGIKPSAIGMELGPFVFARNLSRLVDGLKGKSLEIEVDAECRETLCEVQQVLHALAPKLPTGITFRPAFQMHLPPKLWTELIIRNRILDMPVRIVKGSGLYNVGGEEVTEEEVIARYKETFLEQVHSGKHPNIATVRDKKLLESLCAIAAIEHIYRHQFTIQFLDGPFGRSLAQTYAADGYRVGCYVTFVDPSAPDEWEGYVRRRIAFGRKLMFGR